MKIILSKRKPAPLQQQMELIPLINIFISLILFLLLTTSVISIQTLDIGLLAYEPDPKQKEAHSAQDQNMLFVLLTKSGITVRAGETTNEFTEDNWEEFQSFLYSQKEPFDQVFLRTSTSREHQTVVRVIDQIRQSGATKSLSLSPRGDL